MEADAKALDAAWLLGNSGSLFLAILHLTLFIETVSARSSLRLSLDFSNLDIFP